MYLQIDKGENRMSGGYFDYNQYKIDDIADEIERLIESNDCEELDEYGDKKGFGCSQEIIFEFKNALIALRIASIYAKRIDWLLSGDDEEEEFHKGLKKDLSSMILDKMVEENQLLGLYE
jgi:hypothetical protein